MDAAQRARHAARARRGDRVVEEAPAAERPRRRGAGARRRSLKSSRRARPTRTRRRPEARRRSRQSRHALPRHAAQRRVPGDRRAGAARRRGVRHGAGRRAGGARRLGAGPVLLAKPLTMMNLSGEAVGALARYHKMEIGRPARRRRRREPAARAAAGAARRIGRAGTTGSSRSRSTSGTDEFARLRVGVGRGDAGRDLADHVLATFDAGRAAGDRGGESRRRPMPSDLFVADGIEAGDEPVQRRPATEERSEDSTTAREGQSSLTPGRVAPRPT